MAKQKAPDADANPAAAPDGYTVLARRYRPQTFEDLVGQEAVARALANALKGNRVAHAYLFTGARGVGKTSTARILAKALNCEKGPTATPCNACPPCLGIAGGDDVDVIEIDGASNNGVDEVRELRANVGTRPARSRYKIYIIDEVHMLSKAAFNALLKTLEEPPPHVKFVFATTEAQKIPITILSRCQRFDFAGIPPAAIVEQLRTIARQEGVEVEDEALELTARRAGGSMRDAQSLFDQLLAFGGDKLTADQVHQLLGMAGDDRVVALADAVVGRDAARALGLFEETASGGLQMGELLDQLIAYWRDLMVVQCAGPQARGLSVPPRRRPDLERQAKALTADAVLAGLDVLSAARGRVHTSSHGRTLVEMALVRLCRLSNLLPVAQLAQLVNQPRSEPAGNGAASARAVAPPEGVKKNALTGAANGAGAVAADGPEALGRQWPEVLLAVGPMLASQLEKAGIPATIGPNTLVLRFPVAYNQEREHCQEPSRLTKIETIVRRVTGRQWNLRVEGDAAGPSAPAAPAAEPAAPRNRRNARAEAEKDSLVRRALDALGAQLLRVDDDFGAAAERPAADEGP
jgi:DNA polymerase-3 subunit gamma/tau